MATTNDIESLKDLVTSLLSRLDQSDSAIALLQSDNAVLRADNAALKANNVALEAENADLRSRLNMNSGNSSKPPSSDGLTKKPAFAQSKGQKSGGQVGHKGKTLKMVATPDHVIIHHLPSCPCCSKIFSSSDVDKITLKRQVFDIPEPRLEVVEHQLGVITCCGRSHEGIFPSGVNSRVQYGSKIKSLSVLLSTDYKMPFDKIEQLFSDIYACSFNQSTAISANNACFSALEPIEEQIKNKILASPVVHFDETGMRVEGKLNWFHTASTQLYTYLFVHPKRGKDALNSTQSLIKDFTNCAIHDCWASYFEFKNCSHALCNAHIIRELEALKEQGTLWAIEMQQFLFNLFKISEKATVVVPNQPIWLKKYQIICQKADEQEPPPTQKKRGKPKNSKGRNLLNRLTKHQEAILAFAFMKLVPFTNNQAERDIRCLKTKQKAANSFRKMDGAMNFARIQGFISSARKHKTNVFNQIQNVFNKQDCLFILG